MIFRHLSRDFSEREPQPRGSKRKMKTKQPRGGFGFFIELNGWLVALTILKNIVQWEGLSHILWKIVKKKHPNVPNHQPDQPVLGFKQQKYTKIAIKNGIQWDLTKKDAK